jgi:HD-like signal output (HDOD) protein
MLNLPTEAQRAIVGDVLMLKPVADMLRNMFRANRQSLRDRTAETVARLEHGILALVDKMPPLPDTATRALTLAREPNTKFADFARLIETDAAIATGILRIANSALYASGCPATKLQQAVVRLGMSQCQNVIISISMRSLFRQMAPGLQAQCEILWHHAYVTAFLCRQISRRYRFLFDGEEFFAGLLHDLGRILLLLADPECFQMADAMDFTEDENRLDRERAAIGIDHCALGGWFGEHSRLPRTLVEAMRFHHEPQRAENARRLVELVAASDHMANHVQRREFFQDYQAENNVALASLVASWPEARKERLFAEIPFMMKESIDAVLGHA